MLLFPHHTLAGCFVLAKGGSWAGIRRHIRCRIPSCVGDSEATCVQVSRIHCGRELLSTYRCMPALLRIDTDFLRCVFQRCAGASHSTMDKLWVGYEQFEKSQAAACLAVASLRNDPLVEFGAGLGNSSLPGQSCLSGEADVRAHAAVCPWQSSIQGTAAGGRRYLST